MKKFLIAVATAFVAMTASASNVEKIQFANAGQLTLGAMVGLPHHTPDANMPAVSIDGMIGLKDGFINTKTFGQNGAIDLGVYVGFCQYGWSSDIDKWSFWNLPIAVRSGFHWEFVKNLDVYAGFQAGIAIEHGMYKIKIDGANDDRDGKGYVGGIFGMYSGAKWYFTDAFGVKLEWSSDWINCHGHQDRGHHPAGWGNNMPPVSAGVTFKF